MMALAAQTSILSTVIVALVIIAIVAWIIKGMIQKKKRSGTFIGCDCGCANCPHSCHNSKNSKNQSGCGGCGGCQYSEYSRNLNFAVLVWEMYDLDLSYISLKI